MGAFFIFISMKIDELTRYRKEKGKKYDVYHVLKRVAKDPHAFVHFSDLDKLGINPQSSFNTPIGIYGYPLEAFDIEDIIKGNVPFAGDRHYIHIFSVKPEYRDSVVFLSRDGSAINDDSDKEYENRARAIQDEAEIAQQELADKNRKIYQDIEAAINDFIDILERSENKVHKIVGGILGSNYQNLDFAIEMIKSVAADKENKTTNQVSSARKLLDFIIIAQDEMGKNLKKRMNFLDQRAAIASSDHRTRFGEYWNATRLKNRKNPQKWAKTLVGDGIVGVVDYGSGIIHSNEPTQAVFFSKKFIDHIGTVPNKNELAGMDESVGPYATTPHSTHLQSRVPKPWPRGGQSGDPNQAPTMTASRMMQQTSTEDDIKYWMGDPDDPDDVGATFNPPYDFPFYHSDYTRFEDSPERVGVRDEYLNSMNESNIRKIVREMIIESLEEEELDEVSAVGGAAMGMAGQPSGQIRGHIGPLGSDNRSPHLKKKKKKKHYEPSMRAFGGASEAD